MMKPFCILSKCIYIPLIFYLLEIDFVSLINIYCEIIHFHDKWAWESYNDLFISNV